MLAVHSVVHWPCWWRDTSKEQEWTVHVCSHMEQRTGSMWRTHGWSAPHNCWSTDNDGPFSSRTWNKKSDQSLGCSFKGEFNKERRIPLAFSAMMRSWCFVAITEVAILQIFGVTEQFLTSHTKKHSQDEPTRDALMNKEKKQNLQASNHKAHNLVPKMQQIWDYKWWGYSTGGKQLNPGLPR